MDAHVIVMRKMKRDGGLQLSSLLLKPFVSWANRRIDIRMVKF